MFKPSLLHLLRFMAPMNQQHWMKLNENSVTKGLTYLNVYIMDLFAHCGCGETLRQWSGSAYGEYFDISNFYVKNHKFNYFFIEVFFIDK